MQVTEGRASQPLDAEMAELVWKRLKSLIPQEQMQRIVHVASGDALPATLQKALAVQAFGFAAGHVSKAKSEMHQFSCLRWTMHGTREVAILAYEPASTALGGNKPMSFQEVVTWAMSASLSEIRKLVSACPSSVFVGTVGPRDMLYVPASSITFHKVFGDSDALGVRAAFLGGLDAKALPGVRIRPAISCQA